MQYFVLAVVAVLFCLDVANAQTRQDRLAQAVEGIADSSVQALAADTLGSPGTTDTRGVPVTVVGTVVSLDDCWLLIIDGGGTPQELVSLPMKYQQTGMRVRATLHPLGRGLCRNGGGIPEREYTEQVEEYTEQDDPPVELRSFHEAVAGALADADIQARTEIRDLRVMIEVLSRTSPGQVHRTLLSAVRDRWGMLHRPFPLRGAGVISIWPATAAR